MASYSCVCQHLMIGDLTKHAGFIVVVCHAMNSAFDQSSEQLNDQPAEA